MVADEAEPSSTVCAAVLQVSHELSTDLQRQGCYVVDCRTMELAWQRQFFAI